MGITPLVENMFNLFEDEGYIKDWGKGFRKRGKYAFQIIV